MKMSRPRRPNVVWPKELDVRGRCEHAQTKVTEASVERDLRQASDCACQKALVI